MNDGRFKKGSVSLMKGKHHTPETLKKISESLKGRSVWNKGRKETRPEVLLKQSESHLGKVSGMKGKKGFIAWNKGKKCPERSGPNNNKWKGGVTPVNKKIRKSLEYKLWRESVFIRDGYTCVWCGYKGYVEADHIKPFCGHPELRFSIDNGRTLCKDCHRKTDTFGNDNRDNKGRFSSLGRAAAQG